MYEMRSYSFISKKMKLGVIKLTKTPPSRWTIITQISYISPYIEGLNLDQKLNSPKTTS